MLSIALSFLTTLLSGLAKAWFAEQDVVNSGVEKQQLADQVQVNAQITQAQTLRDSYVPITAEQLSNIKPGSDPNFRD